VDNNADALTMTDDEDDDDESDEDIRDNNNVVDPFAVLKSTPEYKQLCEEFEAEEVVLAALISCPAGDLDQLTDWCYEERTKETVMRILAEYSAERRKNCHNVVSAGSRRQKTKVTQKRVISVQEEASLNYSIGPTGALLSEQFATVWAQFLDRAESLDIKECLSFKLLACCLNDLAVDSSRPQRRFLAQFAEGSPNLVICAEAEMQAVLGI